MHAMSKARELRELARDELEQRVQDKVKAHFDLRKTKATGKLENPLQLRWARREIARLRTVIHQQEHAKETGQTGHGDATRKA